MRAYTAHIKPNRVPVLIREGWSWAGFLFGPLWLLMVRAWIPAVLEIAVLVLVLGLAPQLAWPALGVAALLNGLLGRDAVRWTLQRRGYALDHVVLAPNHDAASLRLFTARPDLIDPAR